MRTTAVLILACGVLLAEDASPQRIQELVGGLKSRYFDERDDAKKQLEAIGAAAEEPLVGALADGDYRVRSAAVELLGKMKSAKALPKIIDALTDADEVVSTAARSALFTFGKEARAAVDARRAADPKFAESTAEMVRAWIGWDVEATLDPLMTSNNGWGFWEGQYKDVVALGPDAIPVLVAMFTDPAYEFHTNVDRPDRQLVMRILAGEALAEVPSPDFVPRVKDALDGKTPATTQMWSDGRQLFEEAAAYAVWMHGEKGYLQAQEKRWRDLSARGGSYRARLAFVVIRQQRYEEAVKIYEEEIAENAGDSSSIFNLATVYGKMGKKDLALSKLKEAVEAGYDNVEWLQREGYFECIRGTPGFEAVMQQLGGGKGNGEEGKPQ